MAHIFFNSTGGNTAASDSESVPANGHIIFANMTDRVLDLNITTSSALADDVDETYNNEADVVQSITETQTVLRMAAGTTHAMHNGNSGTVIVDLPANLATFSHTAVGINGQRVACWVL